MIKENIVSIYTIKSLNYERCEQRFVYSKCRKKNAVFDMHKQTQETTCIHHFFLYLQTQQF